MRTAIWLSFDLGLRGDYEGLYTWLDEHDAEECGDNVAYMKKYEYEGNLPNSLQSDLKGAIEVTKKTRIYVVWGADGKAKGRFVLAARKSAPWAGSRGSTGEPELDES